MDDQEQLQPFVVQGASATISGISGAPWARDEATSINGGWNALDAAASTGGGSKSQWLQRPTTETTAVLAGWIANTFGFLAQPQHSLIKPDFRPETDFVSSSGMDRHSSCDSPFILHSPTATPQQGWNSMTYSMHSRHRLRIRTNRPRYVASFLYLLGRGIMVLVNFIVVNQFYWLICNDRVIAVECDNRDVGVCRCVLQRTQMKRILKTVLDSNEQKLRFSRLISLRWKWARVLKLRLSKMVTRCWY